MGESWSGWKGLVSSPAPVATLSFDDVREAARTIPRPTVDLISVHCGEEYGALRVMLGSERVVSSFPNTLLLGIPIVMDSNVPPGVIRFSLDGEVVKELLL